MPSHTALSFLLGMTTALSPCLATAADIYGYVDGDGIPHYSDVPNSSRYQLVLRNPDDYKLKADDRYRLRGLRANGIPVSPDQPPVAQTPPVFDTQRPFGAIISREAESNSLDPQLIDALIAVESNHNPSARSPKGAIGLMQLMPDTAKRYGIADPYKAESNIRGGTRYLRDLLLMFDGDLHLALAAYNAGEKAVIRFGNRIPPYPETQNYVPKVLKKYHALLGNGAG